MAIGFIVYAGIVCAAGISGAAFNPAVIIGISFVKYVWKIWKIGYVLFAVLVQLLGSFAGAAVFYIVAPDEFEHFSSEYHEIRGEVTERARDFADGVRSATQPSG